MATQRRLYTVRTDRPDNLRYTCGHTGHVVLPECYDNRTEILTAMEFLQDQGGLAKDWLCTDCWVAGRYPLPS